MGNEIELTARPARERRVSLGVGFNIFDHLGSGGFYARAQAYPLHEQVCPDPNSPDWAVLEQGLSELRPGFLRFGLPPDPHVDPVDGSLITATVHLQRLVKFNQWALAHGCTILVDTFTIPRYFEYPLPAQVSDPGLKSVNMAPADVDDYAERFVAPLLRHLVHDLKLEAVRWFNPVNEPLEYGVFQTPAAGPDAFVHYVQMYRAMRQALDDADVPRARVGLMGVDSSAYDYLLWDMLSRDANPDPYLDAYSRHFYRLRFDYLPDSPQSDSSPLVDAMDRQTGQLVRYANRRGKPLAVTEIGTFFYGWKRQNPSGCASFDATLTVAEGVIRGLIAGVECFAFWCLLNSNRIDGWWRVIGVENGELVRAGFPFAVYGTLCRAIRPGATVYPMRCNHPNLHAAALENPDGSRAVLIVNDDPCGSWPLRMTLPAGWPSEGWQCRITDRVRQDQSAETPNAIADVLAYTAPAFSLSYLSQRRQT